MSKADMNQQLATLAATSPAGMEQAKRGISRTERSRKALETAVAGKARSTSFSISAADDAILSRLAAEMAAKGLRVGDSHLVRAGLRALDELPIGDLEILVRQARDADGRRRK